MARRETYEHMGEDNLQARVIDYDSEKKVGTLEFVNHRVRLRLKGEGGEVPGREEVMESLRLPSKYFLRISYGALLGRRLARELGDDNPGDYEFSEGEDVWYNAELLGKLIKEKKGDVEGVEIDR